jgi:hypothetical protein
LAKCLEQAGARRQLRRGGRSWVKVAVQENWEDYKCAMFTPYLLANGP